MHKIFGIGIDIVQNARIKNLIDTYENNFLNKVFSVEEIEAAPINKYNYFAKRFAAKEAFVKALGIGFSSNIIKSEISVTNDEYGRPRIEIYGQTKDYVEKIIKHPNIQYFISLSDEKEYSIAQVLICLE